MTDPNEPGALPPDLPPEYADAYRRGYERAYLAPVDDVVGEQVEQPTELVEPTGFEPVVHPDQQVHIDSLDDLFAGAEPTPWVAPTHRDPDRRIERPGWLIPAALAAMVVALILGAYGAGRLFSDQVSSDTGTEPDSLSTPQSKPSKPGKQKPTRAAENPPTGSPYDGQVAPIEDVRATVDCVLGASTDAAGHRVTYTPDKMFDGDFSTAWRCAGDGRSVKITLSFSDTVELAEVGIVGGYAKTDARSHADRYAENNRLTAVRWTFPDGHSVVQQLDGSPQSRDLQTMRIPVVETDSVTLELLSSTGGPRNTVAISELRLAEAD